MVCPVFGELTPEIAVKFSYQNAQFLTGAAHFAQLPVDCGFEVAFAGRSNVGKSSALNAITGIGRLARASRTPGRTQQINFFALDATRRLVDLPGYGYAQAPADVQRRWQDLVTRYIHERRSLHGVVVLMDIRHPLTALDQAMLQWCASHSRPAHVLLTKADKLSRSAAQKALHQMQTQLVGQSVQLFSALRHYGVEEARAILSQWLSIGA